MYIEKFIKYKSVLKINFKIKDNRFIKQLMFCLPSMHGTDTEIDSEKAKDMKY